MRRRGPGRARPRSAQALRRRPPFRARTVRVRLYDARGQGRSLDPDVEPGRTLVARAEELVRLAPGGS